MEDKIVFTLSLYILGNFTGLQYKKTYCFLISIHILVYTDYTRWLGSNSYVLLILLCLKYLRISKLVKDTHFLRQVGKKTL